MTFDVVVIGAGKAGMAVAGMLVGGGLKCAVFSKGSPLERVSTEAFIAAGGVLFSGDSVVSGNFDKDGKLISLSTEKLGPDSVRADWFVLSSGKYFSKGIQVGMSTIRESIFGCDLYYDNDRSKWFDNDFYAAQPFMEFGVIVDKGGRTSIGGNIVPNLYAAGEILRGIDGSNPKSDKLIQKSAVRAAESILKDAGKNNKRK